MNAARSLLSGNILMHSLLGNPTDIVRQGLFLIVKARIVLLLCLAMIVRLVGNVLGEIAMFVEHYLLLMCNRGREAFIEGIRLNMVVGVAFEVKSVDMV